MSETGQTQVPELVDQAVDTHDKKSPQESFAELRKQKDDIERQKWQAEQELKWYKEQMQLQAQQSKQVLKPDEEEDFDFKQLEKEEFVDGKNIVKAFNTLTKKLSAYDQKLAAKDQKIQLLEANQTLPDFAKVVTPENIEKYIKSDEDNLEAMQKTDNPLRKAYNLIVKSAAYQTDMAKKVEKPVSQEQKRIDEKGTKPKTTSLGVRSEAVSIAASTSNSKMTRQQKESLWLETQALARK